MTTCLDKPQASESTLTESTGCAFVLDDPATGCVQAASEDGKADTPPHEDTGSTGRAAAVPASDEPTTPNPPQTLRLFEHALRHKLGYSQRQAAAIAKSGFRATDEVDEPDDGIDQLRDALQRSIASLKAKS